jgi:hypothetical protein
LAHVIKRNENLGLAARIMLFPLVMSITFPYAALFLFIALIMIFVAMLHSHEKTTT